MKKLIFSIALTIFAPTVLACSAISPESSFMHQFDQNKDGVLNKTEFKKIKKAPTYKVDFKFADMKAFKQLDRNKNRTLSREELQEHIDYVRHPCASWEEKMRELSQTVEVYKSDDARQCMHKGITPEEMQKQLGQIHVYQTRKAHLKNVAFPSVCGGETGTINVYRIAEYDVEQAKKYGFMLLNTDE